MEFFICYWILFLVLDLAVKLLVKKLEILKLKRCSYASDIDFKWNFWHFNFWSLSYFGF